MQTIKAIIRWVVTQTNNTFQNNLQFRLKIRMYIFKPKH